MIYVDSSVVLAHLLDESRKPPAALWRQPLVSSRLLFYEVWNRVHAYGVASRLGGRVEGTLGVVALVELSEEVLRRAAAPFAAQVRTLDALHLASASFLRGAAPDLRLATYDRRMAEAAATLGLPMVELDP